MYCANMSVQASVYFAESPQFRGCHLVNELQRAAVAMNLLNFCGPKNHSADILIFDCPNQCKLANRSPKFIRYPGQRADFLNLRYSFFALQTLNGAPVGCQSRILWNSIIVLPVNRPLARGLQIFCTVVELVKYWSILDVEPFTMETIVRLLGFAR